MPALEVWDLDCCSATFAWIASRNRRMSLRPLRYVNIREQLRRFAEHNNAVADADRFFELMGDENRSRAGFARQFEERFAQFSRGHFVEMTERLVRQHDIGLDREGPRNRHTLAHAADNS